MSGSALGDRMHSVPRACICRGFCTLIYVVVFDIVVVSCVVRKGKFPSMTDCSRYCIACTTLCCFMLQCSLHIACLLHRVW